MRIINLRTTAFTLLEVLLASIIFIVAVLGVFSTLSAVRIPVQQKERALTAAVFGQLALETLRAQVNASSTSFDAPSGCYNYTNQLALGAHPTASNPALLSQTDQNVTTYSMSYTVSCASAGGGCPAGYCPADTAMMVNLAITFPDTT